MDKKNRKRLKKINIDKKVELLNRVYDLLKHNISEIKNEIIMIHIKILDGLDKDTLHLVKDKLNKLLLNQKT